MSEDTPIHVAINRSVIFCVWCDEKIAYIEKIGAWTSSLNWAFCSNDPGLEKKHEPRPTDLIEAFNG